MVNAWYADLGRTNYQQVLGLQKMLADMRHNGQVQDIILLTEHNPCVLFGRDSENSFHEDFTKRLDASGRNHGDHMREFGIRSHTGFHSASTYIGPGQLAVYPINDYTRLLKKHDVPGYNSVIDGTVIRVMDEFGISNITAADNRLVVELENGVNPTIAAKGLHMTHRIASHGFQVHVNREGTRHFDMIKPSGYAISMEDVLERNVDVSEVKESVLSAIRRNFDYDRVERCKIKKSGNSITIRKR